MGINANPPPQSKLPAKILNDDELRDYFVAQQEDMYRLWLRSGGGTDNTTIIIEQLKTIKTNQSAALDDINERLGSGDPLTWDETGFSWDSTNLTFDQTEA